MSESIAEKSWEFTRDANDPHWRGSGEIGFWENQQFRADKVIETGVANTNFEKAVAKFASEDAGKDPAPNAVVDTNPGINLEAAAEGLVEKTPAEKAEVKAADGKVVQAEIDALENEKKAKEAEAKEDKTKDEPKGKVAKDESGHVPTASEAKATLKAEKDAPLHP